MCVTFPVVYIYFNMKVCGYTWLIAIIVRDWRAQTIFDSLKYDHVWSTRYDSLKLMCMIHIFTDFILVFIFIFYGFHGRSTMLPHLPTGRFSKITKATNYIDPTFDHLWDCFFYGAIYHDSFKTKTGSYWWFWWFLRPFPCADWCKTGSY